MYAIKTLIQLITIVLALAGAYFIAYTADTMRGRMDSNLLRAKVFLNESFMKDNWFFLFLASFFFLVNATINFNEILGISFEKSSSDLIEHFIVLGVLTCSVLSEYKWFRLVSKGHIESGSKESSIFKKRF